LIVVVVILIGIVVDAVGDDVPDTERLEINLHDQSPLGVIGPREHRPRDVRGRALNNALYDA
jgi:hypothetical protein